MNWPLILELFGYLGSVLILVSMLMTSVVRLRVINLIGSAIFAVYALLIRSYPTAFLNACLVGINVYQLLKLKRKTGKGYELLTLDGSDGFAEWFTEKYGDDIKKFFPDVSAESIRQSEGFAVLMEDCAAGILLGTRSGDGFEVLLDYTTPAYRDCSAGKFVCEQLPSLGITRLHCVTTVPEHAAYLKRMGFSLSEDGGYFKLLTAAVDRS